MRQVLLGPHPLRCRHQGSYPHCDFLVLSGLHGPSLPTNPTWVSQPASSFLLRTPEFTPHQAKVSRPIASLSQGGHLHNGFHPLKAKSTRLSHMAQGMHYLMVPILKLTNSLATWLYNTCKPRSFLPLLRNEASPTYYVFSCETLSLFLVKFYC